MSTQILNPEPQTLNPADEPRTPNPHPCSDKRLAANRANAQKSTGPKTPEGKSRSSQNSLTQGLTSQSPSLLPKESPEQYEQFCIAMHKDLHPQSPIETILVNRITHLAWQLQRIPQTEFHLLQLPESNRRQRQIEANQQAQINYEHKSRNYHRRDRLEDPPPTPSPMPPDRTPAEILANYFWNQDDKSNPIQRLHRYAFALERSFFKALHEFQSLKRLRVESPPLETPAQEQIEANPLHEPPSTSCKGPGTNDQGPIPVGSASADACAEQQNEPIASSPSLDQGPMTKDPSQNEPIASQPPSSASPDVERSTLNVERSQSAPPQIEPTIPADVTNSPNNGPLTPDNGPKTNNQ